MAQTIAALAGELCADDSPDGIQTRERLSQSAGKPSPHAGRVCKAAQRVVDTFLAAAPAATGLRHFIVASVRPVRGAAVLRVTIEPQAELPAGLATDRVLAALRGQRAHLRGMLAATIDGKKTPELQFVLKLAVCAGMDVDLDD
ncbi:MAG: hypothetical protein IPG61_08170 [bacterium]|nr:hypothetical protein [bacterium]